MEKKIMEPNIQGYFTDTTSCCGHLRVSSSTQTTIEQSSIQILTKLNVA